MTDPTDAEIEAAAKAIQTTFEAQGFADEAVPGNTEADQYRDMARAALTAAAQLTSSLP